LLPSLSEGSFSKIRGANILAVSISYDFTYSTSSFGPRRKHSFYAEIFLSALFIAAFSVLAFFPRTGFAFDYETASPPRGFYGTLSGEFGSPKQ